MTEPVVTLRILEGEPVDMAALQAVIEGAPVYAQLVTGASPGAADAQSVYTMLPPGKGYDDKFVLGIEADGAMVGCIDCIRGYPDASTAYVGLLLIAEKHRRRGLGRAACRALEACVSRWDGITRVRLGVLRTNEDARRFWLAQGFRATGETKPYRYGPIVTATLLFEKRLVPA
jgi:RimJ/RimL family protein N-acetyltransferase